MGTVTLGIDVHQYTLQRTELERAVFKKMEMGSKPWIPHLTQSPDTKGKVGKEIIIFLFPISHQ